MRGEDGKPAVCDGAWISYLTGADEENFVLSGKLTAGYGSMWGQDRSRPGEKFGPEFTFGLTMDAAFDEGEQEVRLSATAVVSVTVTDRAAASVTEGPATVVMSNVAPMI